MRRICAVLEGLSGLVGIAVGAWYIALALLVVIGMPLGLLMLLMNGDLSCSDPMSSDTMSKFDYCKLTPLLWASIIVPSSIFAGIVAIAAIATALRYLFRNFNPKATMKLNSEGRARQQPKIPLVAYIAASLLAIWLLHNIVFPFWDRAHPGPPMRAMTHWSAEQCQEAPAALQPAMVQGLCGLTGYIDSRRFGPDLIVVSAHPNGEGGSVVVDGKTTAFASLTTEPSSNGSEN